MDADEFAESAEKESALISDKDQRNQRDIFSRRWTQMNSQKAQKKNLR